MLTLALLFLIALAGTLLTTPFASFIGRKFGALDCPGPRNVHLSPCPRTGGISLFVVFVLCMGLILYTPLLTPDFDLDTDFILILLGLSVAFGMGLVDDFIRLSCIIKLLLQILSASLAFAGGLQIDHFFVMNFHLHFTPVISYLLTVFWFLLFLNAVNLIDGLDGLASGIIFFASAVMTILLAWRGEIHSAAWFAIIAGSCMGFLRYNFNPAQIFLGDSGSYFLGYCMAAFSMMAQFKSQIGASMLIPVIGLGVPIMDTLISPIRRFVRGKGMFQPDSDHIHHRLLSKGLNTNQAVWILYCITVGLCIISLYLAHLRDIRGFFLLIFLGTAVIVFMYQLGYFDLLRRENLSRWIQDVSYEAGLTQDRRSFVVLQEAISQSPNHMQLWQNIIIALQLFEFDFGELILFKDEPDSEDKDRFIWTADNQSYTHIVNMPGTMKLELPLITSRNQLMGILWVIKDMHNTSMSHYTLRRIEHLRRSVLKAVEAISRSEH